MKRFAPWLLILLAPLLLSMGKKDEFTITFHSQGSDTDMPKTVFQMMLDGRALLFKTLPEISHNNISAYHSFPAATGGNGLTLQLDFRGTSNLELITRTRRGEYLLALVNGKPADYVVLDQVVTSGMITIWQGVPDTIVAALAKKYAPIKTGSTPSVTDKFDMAPTTPKEKKGFFKRFKKNEREAEKRRKSGEPEEEPEVPSFNLPTTPADPASAAPATSTGNVPALPQNPTSSQMPVEGAAPTTGASTGGAPPLPAYNTAPPLPR